ncbi:MAG: hypothetical protein V1722_05695 [Candidatus Micrarchaeota archaeon]
MKSRVTKTIFIIGLLVLFGVFFVGCTQPSNASDNAVGARNADVEPAAPPVGAGEAVNNTPAPAASQAPASIDVASRKAICAALKEKPEDCIAGIAIDKQDETVCGGITEADLAAEFNDSYYQVEPVDPNKRDSDNDMLSDVREAQLGTNPNKTDTDNDGMFDGTEVGTSDPKNPDTDGDGIMDGGEDNSYTDPTDASDKPTDADHDGMADNWETKYGLNPASASDASLDTDGDGLTNLQEYLYSGSPIGPDGDNDGFTDAEEIAIGSYAGSNLYTPNDADYSGDGTPDKHEEDVAKENRANELRNAKNTCYAVIAINMRNAELCSKSGWIGGGALSVEFSGTCRTIIEKLAGSEAEKADVCDKFSGTLALARVPC